LLAMMGALDEQLWECCICREGYDMCPTEPLGVHVFANHIGELVSTATYFVCVHASCHKKDRPRDRGRGDSE